MRTRFEGVDSERGSSISDSARESIQGVEVLDHEGLARRVKEAKEMNKTLVMLERLQHPEIQKQLRSVAETYRHAFAKAPEQVITDINKRIGEERNITHIMLEEPAAASRYNALTGKAKIGIKSSGEFDAPEAREYIEAHEKGHAIRIPLLTQSLGLSRRMSKGFSAWSYYKEKGLQAVFGSPVSYWLFNLFGPVAALGYFAITMLQPSYARSSWEMYERMSQLKNYFGFKDNERFTKAHLDYARKHYIADTGVDNNMRAFLRSITPKTEREFLNIMNSFGV